MFDPDDRRGARVSRELLDQPLHFEMLENMDQFVDVAPAGDLIFFADVRDSYGYPVNAMTQQSEVLLPVITHAEGPSSKDVVDAMLAWACGYLDWPFDWRELKLTSNRALYAKGNDAGIKLERMLPAAVVEAVQMANRETVSIDLRLA